MALYRIGRGWSASEMKGYLAALHDRKVNFETPVQEMTAEHGWTIDGDDDDIGSEPPGPPLPDGYYSRARRAIINYDFSDPRIVIGHYDPESELKGRDILLEIKVLGFRFLNGCRVMEVRDGVEHGTTYFGFRYDTLEGHIERGFEWFLLTKDHETGAIHFRIEAHWRLGDFPTWWSRLGFRLFGDWFRRYWRHQAPARLRKLAKAPAPEPAPTHGELAHRGGDEPVLNEPEET